MTELRLHTEDHPRRSAQEGFDELIGIDKHKEALLEELVSLFDPEPAEAWRRKHHPEGLRLAERLDRRSPLILLSGDVGCGKTALARSIGTPLADRLDRKVLTMEAPTDLRGSGFVGELSKRITGSVEQAKALLQGRRKKVGLLLFDEADDVATERGQLQAHHEDRAGVNALIKQIDQIGREEELPLVVLLITNRPSALDPAILRRAGLHLRFRRPDRRALEPLYVAMLRGTTYTPEELASLIEETASSPIPYSYSDLFERVARRALGLARAADRPFSAALVREALGLVEPSPPIEQPRRSEIEG